LTYAKRLQTAILPPDSHFDRLLPDSFVLYLPKDIVAGDFYWLEETADTILVAAADCTGHGVPGAMVSVVCNNALNRAVKEFSLGSPAGILGMTSILVDETFARSQEIVKDGMDISLCVIDFKNSKLRWAGAYNPIWIISKHVKPQLGSPTMQIDELMLYEIKGDKQPIGLVHNRKPFTEHEIDLDKEDVLYIFTDGYADQFGGPKGKKFMYKSLKQLLLQHAMEKMPEQKSILLKAFNNWKGELEQVDDVLLIGIRI
jgi:serine phosphatase RsbU (regulator of sigma subunit)